MREKLNRDREEALDSPRGRRKAARRSARPLGSGVANRSVAAFLRSLTVAVQLRPSKAPQFMPHSQGQAGGLPYVT